MSHDRLTREMIERLWDPGSRRCAFCWGPMRIAEYVDGTAELVCEGDCETTGHVSDIFVNHEILRSQVLAQEVLRYYPELAPPEGLALIDPDRKARAFQALWGADPDEAAAWVRANHPRRRLPAGYIESLQGRQGEGQWASRDSRTGDSVSPRSGASGRVAPRAMMAPGQTSRTFGWSSLSRRQMRALPLNVRIHLSRAS